MHDDDRQKAVFSMIFSNSDANDPSRPISLAYLYAAVTVPVTVVNKEEKRPRTLGGVARSVFLHSPP